MDPAFGYQTALALLQDRFGHPFKIAVAHLNQITHGPPVKPYDQKGLLAFADQLRDCQNALESIGYLNEINSADNLRRIVDRPPFHLKTKWLEIADSIQQTGQRPRIHHISQFVTTKARVANNPVFGGALTNDKEKGNPRNKSLNPGAKMTTYATQGRFRAPVSPSAQVEGVKVDRRLSYKFGINASLKRCLVCHGMHQLWNCEQFKNKSYSDRIRIVRDARLCENCFKIGHMVKGCMQRSGC
ncbi:uncharacterized protein [Montipora foliosa]|uniref:uncharacterized protein n=1 Tax=Montipora foliosa TaxID=591990 RepID=UPI0035F1F130